MVESFLDVVWDDSRPSTGKGCEVEGGGGKIGAHLKKESLHSKVESGSAKEMKRPSVHLFLEALPLYREP